MDLDSSRPDHGPQPHAAFDPLTTTVEALMSHFPDVGVLAAEDIVAYREQYGTFPDLETLVSVLGVEAELAESLLRDSDIPARSTLGPGFTAQPGQEAVVAVLAVPDVDAHAFAPVTQTEPVPPEVLAAPVAPPQVVPPSLPSPLPQPARRRARIPFVVGALVLVNAVLGAGMLHLYREHQRAAAPVAALTVDMDALKAEQAETKTKLADTRARVGKQDGVLARTAAKVDETAKRLVVDEEEAKEREARTTKEMAALGSRMRHVERGVVDGAYALSLKEAVKVIDAVRPPPRSVAPRDSSRGPVSMR
jgi:hypothetical protein